jgi:hypothetical protein
LYKTGGLESLFERNWHSSSFSLHPHCPITEQKVYDIEHFFINQKIIIIYVLKKYDSGTVIVFYLVYQFKIKYKHK